MNSCEHILLKHKNKLARQQAVTHLPNSGQRLPEVPTFEEPLENQMPLGQLSHGATREKTHQTRRLVLYCALRQARTSQTAIVASRDAPLLNALLWTLEESPLI